MIWGYQNILRHKIVHEILLQFENLYEFYEFFMCKFFGSKCPDAHKSYTAKMIW